MPLAQNLLALAVVVLANVAELLLVIALCLTGAQRFGHRHHARPPRLVETRMAVPRMLRRGGRRELIYWRVRRRPRRPKTDGADRVGDRARHQRRVSRRQRDERDA